MKTDVTDRLDEERRNTCSCKCGCRKTEIGGGICRTCEDGDHLWPEAVR